MYKRRHFISQTNLKNEEGGWGDSTARRCCCFFLLSLIRNSVIKTSPPHTHTLSFFLFISLFLCICIFIHVDIWGKDGGGVYVFSLLMFTRSLDNVPQANIVKERPCMHAYTTQTIFMLLPVIFVNILSHSSTYMILSFSFTHTHTLSLPPSVAIALSRREKEWIAISF